MASFSGILRKAFPFISTAAQLGGPLGVMAAQAVGHALGADKVDPAPDSISKVMESAFATPEQRLALQKAEQDFQSQMAELGYKDVETLQAIAAEDRDSARKREMAVRDWTPRILAFGVVILCFLGEGFYFFRGSPSNAAPELIGRILGTMDSALILVLSYYFGSSSGSDAKTSLLASKIPDVK